MKSIFTLLTFFFFHSTSAQVTTEIEYNYLRTSLVKDLSEYRDIKRGYYTQQTDSIKSGSIAVQLIKFGRDKDSTAAGYIVKTVSDEFLGTGTSYWYMPAANKGTMKSFGWDKWNGDIAAMSSGIKNVLLAWFSQRIKW